jgi:hypothetical protein
VCDAVLLGERFAASALGLPENTTVLQNAGNHSFNDSVTSEKTGILNSRDSLAALHLGSRVNFLSMLFTDAENC